MIAFHFQLRFSDNIIDDRLYSNLKKVYEQAFTPACEKTGFRYGTYSGFAKQFQKIAKGECFTKLLTMGYMIVIQKREIL